MSKIEWTGQTWNPIAGCSIVSPGCTDCYAMTMAARLERMNPALEHYKGLTSPSKAGPVWTGKIGIAPDSTLLAPLRRKKPRMYFVNSMSDLFHEDVPDAVIDRVFAVMALAPQHTFQVLTKRTKRMHKYVSKQACAARGRHHHAARGHHARRGRQEPLHHDRLRHRRRGGFQRQQEGRELWVITAR